MAGLNPRAQAYVINVLELREAAMGLQKVLTGSARSNETQVKALQATLPGVEPNSGIVGQKLTAFNQNLGMLAQGLPENTGIPIQVRSVTNQPQTTPKGIPGLPPGAIAGRDKAGNVVAYQLNGKTVTLPKPIPAAVASPSQQTQGAQ
jgi:hypothetical protein